MVANRGPCTSRRSGRALLFVIKASHTLVWFAVEAALGVVLFDGITRHRSRRTAFAATLVAGESIIYLGNGARCPLSSFAERLGAEDGSVTDLFLPQRFARILPVIHVPLVIAALWLHVRREPGVH